MTLAELTQSGRSHVHARLAPESEAPGQARQALSSLRPGLSRERYDELALLVSELVTNSVKHGGLDQGEWVELDVELGEDAVRGEVFDSGPGFARTDAQRPAGAQTSGYGLFLVAEIAERWGVATDRGLTRVWFELAQN